MCVYNLRSMCAFCEIVYAIDSCHPCTLSYSGGILVVGGTAAVVLARSLHRSLSSQNEAKKDHHHSLQKYYLV